MDYNEKRREQARQTEAAILQATIDLARESSFDKLSVRDICARAGITTGAFYHHFPSKNHLLSRGFAPLDTHMEALLANCESRPPLERLWHLLSGYASFMEGMGSALVGRYYEHRLATPAAVSMDATRFTHRALLSCLEDVQRAGLLPPDVSPLWAADFLYRHFRGVVVDWVLHHGCYPLLPKLEQDYQFFQKAFAGVSDAT